MSRIDRYKARIAEYETQLASLNIAITEALATGVANYSIDSGQTNNKVQLYSLDELRRMKNYYENQIDLLYSRIEAKDIIHVGAAF